MTELDLAVDAELSSAFEPCLLPEYLLLLRFKAWKLILDFNTVCLLVSLEYRCVHPLSSSRMDDYNMGMEDTSERSLPEAQSKLDREEYQSVQGYIAIKGTRNGLLLTLEPGTPFSELLKALSDRLAEAPGFFRGASLAVDTSRRLLRGSERTQLENLLANYQMSVTSLEQIIVARKDAETEVPSSPALAHGTPVSTGNLDETVQDQRDLREIADTLFLRRTIRSGQAIHHTSNIIVVGDVNPGAEIVAGGDIIVWGVLRRMV